MSGARSDRRGRSRLAPGQLLLRSRHVRARAPSPSPALRLGGRRALTWATPWEPQGTGMARYTEGGSRVPWVLADTGVPEPRGGARASDSWTKNACGPDSAEESTRF